MVVVSLLLVLLLILLLLPSLLSVTLPLLLLLLLSLLLLLLLVRLLPRFRCAWMWTITKVLRKVDSLTSKYTKKLCPCLQVHVFAKCPRSRPSPQTS